MKNEFTFLMVCIPSSAWTFGSDEPVYWVNTGSTYEAIDDDEAEAISEAAFDLRDLLSKRYRKCADSARNYAKRRKAIEKMEEEERKIASEMPVIKRPGVMYPAPYPFGTVEPSEPTPAMEQAHRMIARMTIIGMAVVAAGGAIAWAFGLYG